MPPSTVDQAAAVPTALAAFLRGVERRAAVFCEMQCGNREVADGALAATMRAFRTHAPTVPMAGWPQRFWALLVATPPLRRPAPGAHWPPALDWLEALDEVPRKALLLRLVAGLPEPEAANVLGLDQREYEGALARACPRDLAGHPDAPAWRALAETLQQHLRELPPERLTRLALLREAAIAPVAAAQVLAAPIANASRARGPVAAQRRSAPGAQGLGRGFWVLGVVLGCALALAVTWEHGSGFPGQSHADAGEPFAEPDIRVEALPETAVAQRFDPAGSTATHPDLALLLDPLEASLAEQADFLAWYVAARANAEAAPEQEEPLGSLDQGAAAVGAGTPAAGDLPAAAPAPRPPTLGAQLQAWEALSPDQRRETRARRGAWLALGLEERSRLREAGAALQALDPGRRAALRSEFDALDERDRWGWRLGVALGAEYPSLFGLLGYVQPDQRDALAAALRDLDAAALGDLALLSQRTPPQGQQDLRAALLAQPPAARGAWLRARVGR